MRFVIAMLLPLSLSLALAKDAGDHQPKQFDWPQWRGPERTGISRETGLLAKWPAKGPKLLWETKDLGGGYSTPTVSAGRVFGMSFRDGKEIVWAVDDATGKELWAVKTAGTVRMKRYGEGPRSSVTVDGDRAYALGMSADLVCLNVKDGEIVWRKSLTKDFGGAMMSQWGWSESPLVDGDLVLCTPGRENTIIALKKKTGETVWKAKVPDEDKAGHASMIAAKLAGQKQYIQFLGKGMVGISDQGKFLWRYDAPASNQANCATPIVLDDFAFAAAAYGKGGGLVKISADGKECKAEQVYFSKNMKNHHGGMVLIDGYLYGCNGGNRETNELVCLDFKSGDVKWRSEKPGKGSISYADGKLYYRCEDGTMYLIEANPKKYVPLGEFNPPHRSSAKTWCHPVIANGKLYLRDQDVVQCHDLKK